MTSLRAFEATARRLSFQDAAAELGVTPTAISHQIHQLEQHCGAALFRRRPRPLILTAAGEALLPVVSEAFQSMAEAVEGLRRSANSYPLRVTTTNALAARWLLPRLPEWRATHPGIKLELIGTDRVLDLRAGEADVAIRYARTAPVGGLRCVELLRDSFHVVATPSLLRGAKPVLTPLQIASLPLLEAAWPPDQAEAPTWTSWAAAARGVVGPEVPAMAGLVGLSFREELHAIDAVIAGQGAAICSDVLVAQELQNGQLLRLSDIKLPGYGLFLVHRLDHPRPTLVATFAAWMEGLAVEWRGVRGSGSSGTENAFQSTADASRFRPIVLKKADFAP